MDIITQHPLIHSHTSHTKRPRHDANNFNSSRANATRTIENYAQAAKKVPQAQIPGGGSAGGNGGGSASPTGGAGGGSNGGSGGGSGATPSSPPTAGAVSLSAPGTLLLALGAGFLLL